MIFIIGLFYSVGKLWVKENPDYCGATKQYSTRDAAEGAKLKRIKKGLDQKETKAEVRRGV